MINVLRVPAILTLLAVIAFCLANELSPLALPAAGGIYWLIKTDQGGKSIEGIYAVLFTFALLSGFSWIMVQFYEWLFFS